MIEVGLVGPGRVGRALVSLLPPERFRIGGVLATTLTSARRAVREMMLGTPTAAPASFASAQVVLISVPDLALRRVVDRLGQAGFSYDRKVVLHTSGARDSSLLRPLRRRGAAIGSMHPLYIFQRPVLTLAGVHFAVEGDSKAANSARTIIRAVDGVFQLVKPAHKIHHSIAKSIASDCVTGLMEAAVRQMTAGGFSRRRAWEAVSRVLAAAQEDYARSGRKSRPGPLLDGNAKTVQHYLEVLSDRDPKAAEVYRLASRQALLALRHNLDGLSFLHED